MTLAWALAACVALPAGAQQAPLPLKRPAQPTKAEITAEVISGHVRIKFKKGQTDGIALYCRLKGLSAWRFVSRDTNSPYHDYTALRSGLRPSLRMPARKP